MLKYSLNQIWDQLRGRKPHLDYFLEEVRIQGLRGIRDLKVRFTYPVSVISGPNSCGKSTVLFALACAYKVPDSGPRDFVPSTLFPDFRTRSAGIPSDNRNSASLEFYYINAGQRYQMKYSRGKGWNKSFMGLKKGSQPKRMVYLRTVANLSNPSEIRSVLQFGRHEVDKQEITSDLLIFAHRILPLKYLHLYKMSYGERDLLYAERDDSDEPTYSEFHMSAGERAILRLSKDLSSLRNALILIDEIEAGLHPFTQQQLMLELQRLALRNDLQIVVTSHSPVILETVPPEGRIFLERSLDNVEIQPAYRDIIQKAFYGRAIDKLSILCEDEVAEAILRGVLDVFNLKFNFSHSDIEVGRDTGKDEFPHHVRAIANFHQLPDFIFVLDADAHDKEAEMRQIASQYGQPLKLIFLPGTDYPENWVCDQIKQHIPEYAERFKIKPENLSRNIDSIDRTFAGATDKPRNKAKSRLIALAEEIGRDVAEISRIVGCTEAERKGGTMEDFVKQLEEIIQSWRNIKE